jgi:hypothetical protein
MDRWNDSSTLEHWTWPKSKKMSNGHAKIISEEEMGKK